MADIFLDQLTYYKTEIDEKDEAVKLYVNDELAKKADNADVGTSGGIATLDDSGDVPPQQIPWAQIGSDNPQDDNVHVMSPSTTYYMIADEAVGKDLIGEANGVAPLNADQKIDTAYLPDMLDRTFDYVKLKDVIIQDTSFIQIARLTTVERQAGIYQITFNVNAQYSSSSNFMKFIYSIDGGQSWSPVVWKQPVDGSDAFILTDTFVHEFTGGVFDCILQGACDDYDQMLTVNFANIMVDRKS